MRGFRLISFSIAIVLVVGLVNLSFSQSTSHAQETKQADWSTWLYNQKSDSLVRVGLNGIVLKEMNYPVLAGQKPLQPTISVSPDGDLIATCAIDEDELMATLIIYDTVRDEILQTRELGDVVYCTLLKQSFSQDGQFLAYGAIYDFYNGQPEEMWLFEVMDIASGDVLYELFFDDESAFDNVDYSGLPGSMLFDTNLEMIVLSWEGYAVDGGFPTLSYIWRYAEGELTQQADKLYGKRGLNILPNRGEIVWLDRNDEDYPPSEELVQTPNLNVVMSSDKTGEHKVIATLGPAQGASLHYIQNGERVLIREIGYDAEIEDIYSHWSILDRNGQRTELPGISVNGIAGTADGFVALQPMNSGVALVHYQFENDVLSDGEMLWQNIIEDTNSWWMLWATPLAGDGSYPAWTAQ